MNKIFKNSLFNVIRVVVLIPIFFFITPYTLHKVGAEMYGLWALIGVLGTYQMFVDLGISAAMIRFVAVSYAKNDVKAINEYLSIGLTIFTILPSIIISVILLFRHYIVADILGVTKSVGLAEYIVIFTSLSIMINLLAMLFKSTLDGIQRMDITNMIMIVQSVIQAASTYLLLEKGYGIIGLAYSLILSSGSSLLLNFIWAKKIIRNLSVNPLLFKVSRFKEIFSYSINLQLSSIYRGLITPLNKIIISHFFGLTLVGSFDISQKFLNQFNSLINTGLSSLFPASAEKFRTCGVEGLERLRKESLKYIYPLTTLIYLSIFIFAPSFINIWLGKDYALVGTVVRIFMVANYMISLAIPVYTFLNGAGYSKDTLFVQLQSGALEILILIFGGLLFGFLGLCSAFAISIIYGFFISHYYYQKKFLVKEFIFKPFLNIKMLLLITIMILIGLIINHYFIISNIPKLLFFGLLYFLLGLIGLLLLKLLTIESINKLLGRKII